jgi:hypothetical protein
VEFTLGFAFNSLDRAAHLLLLQPGASYNQAHAHIKAAVAV